MCQSFTVTPPPSPDNISGFVAVSREKLVCELDQYLWTYFKTILVDESIATDIECAKFHLSYSDAQQKTGALIEAILYHLDWNFFFSISDILKTGHNIF